MTNIKRTEKLGLIELNVVNDDDSEYEAENVKELRKCPRCGLSALNIKMNHDRKLNDCLSKTCDGAPITLSDTQIIRLIHKHAHFRCMNGECGVKMLETPIKFAEMGSRYTCRLEWLVFNAYLSKSPKEIIASCSNSLPKGETWISEQAIKDIYQRISKKLDDYVPERWNRPKELGFHVVEDWGRTLLIAMDFGIPTVLDVLNDINTETIRAFSEKFGLQDIKVIWVDLLPVLMNNIREVFPEAEIRAGRPQLEERINKAIKDELSESGGREYKAIYGTIAGDINADDDHADDEGTKKKVERIARIFKRTPSLEALGEMRKKAKNAPKGTVLKEIDEIRDKTKKDLSKAVLDLYKDLDSFKAVLENTEDFDPENENGTNYSSCNQAIDSVVDEAMENRRRKVSPETLRSLILYGSGVNSMIPPEIANQRIRDFEEFKKEYEAVFANRIRHDEEELTSREQYLIRIFDYYDIRYTENVITCFGQPLEKVAARLRDYAAFFFS